MASVAVPKTVDFRSSRNGSVQALLAKTVKHRSAKSTCGSAHLPESSNGGMPELVRVLFAKQSTGESQRRFESCYLRYWKAPANGGQSALKAVG